MFPERISFLPCGERGRLHSESPIRPPPTRGLRGFSVRQRTQLGYGTVDQRSPPGGRANGCDRECSASFFFELSLRLARMTFWSVSSALAVETRYIGFRLCTAMYSSMAEINSGTLRKTPHSHRSVEMLRKRRSTMLSQDTEVGVKWIWKRGCFSSHCRTVGCLWVASLSLTRTRRATVRQRTDALRQCGDHALAITAPGRVRNRSDRAVIPRPNRSGETP